MRSVRMRLAVVCAGSVLLLVVGVFGLPFPAGLHNGLPADAARDSGDEARVEALLGRLPLYFVENRGQEDPRVAYYVPGGDTTVYFASDGVTFAMATPASHSSARGIVRVSAARREPAARERWAVKLEFVGANPAVTPRGQEPSPAQVSYFKGPASQWKTGLKTYASVLYADLWPGIDLVYGGTAGRLKYTFLVKPGADPARIKLAYLGATDVRVNGAGQLEVSTPVGGFSDDQPYAYQEAGGRRVGVSMEYALAASSATGAQGYGFRLGDYDRSRPLVLDPSFLV